MQQVSEPTPSARSLVHEPRVQNMPFFPEQLGYETHKLIVLLTPYRESGVCSTSYYLRLTLKRKPSLCGHCRLIFLPESFNVDEEDRTIVTGYSYTDRLTGLPTFQKDTVAGCTFCAELNKVRGETIGLAILLHKSLREAELTPEQEGISVLEVAVKSAQVSTTIRFDIFATPGSYADTHIQVR
jgi:hypothetical protein